MSAGAIAGCIAVPKCFGCLAAYLGIGAMLGLRPAVELCGATGSGGPGAVVASGVAAAVGGVVAAFAWHRR
jgi:hypothetical protein